MCNDYDEPFFSIFIGIYALKGMVKCTPHVQVFYHTLSVKF